MIWRTAMIMGARFIFIKLTNKGRTHTNTYAQNLQIQKHNLFHYIINVNVENSEGEF